jgi:putative nucleotidyltransferase with HDIG domain
MRLAQAAGASEEQLCTLHEWIVQLGVSAIRNLVFISAIAPTDAATSLRLRALCQHSHLAALLTRRMALLSGYPNPDVAQVAALLHDMGKVPFIASLPQGDFGRVSIEVASSHSIVGARLSKHWNLPAVVSEVIEFHHNAADARRDPSLVRMVVAADRLCHAHGVGLDAAPATTFKHTDYAAILAEGLPRLQSEQQVRLAELLESDFLCWLAAARNP